jgi:hypothetical protein
MALGMIAASVPVHLLPWSELERCSDNCKFATANDRLRQFTLSIIDFVKSPFITCVSCIPYQSTIFTTFLISLNEPPKLKNLPMCLINLGMVLYSLKSKWCIAFFSPHETPQPLIPGQASMTTFTWATNFGWMNAAPMPPRGLLCPASPPPNLPYSMQCRRLSRCCGLTWHHRPSPCRCNMCPGFKFNCTVCC